ncbi:MOSC domain-containing protein [Sphingoaurantiacus capsulatus]|uniref:MOSC domain-containing protein n=1 Tax=Sphingoaurantiacus capsulatus TaxID=1771310 RepID=A0ABV7XBI5_9SPHN
MRRLIGVVAELNRFPVKSMAGEELAEAEVRWSGLRGDREYGFVKADSLRRFPWFTGRDHSALLRYRAASAGDYGSAGLPVEVATPDGRRLGVGDPALAKELAAAAGGPVQLIQLSRGTYDSMPVSLVTRATLAVIDAAHGASLDPRRFRINIVIDSAERDIEWRGRSIEFGLDGARLAVVRPIERCAMITIDPDTAGRDASVMRTVARQFGNEVGEYASVLRQGPVRIGDEVYLVDEAAAPVAITSELAR